MLSSDHTRVRRVREAGRILLQAIAVVLLCEGPYC